MTVKDIEMGQYLRTDDTNESEPFLSDEIFTESKSSTANIPDEFRISGQSLPARFMTLTSASTRPAKHAINNRTYSDTFKISIWYWSLCVIATGAVVLWEGFLQWQALELLIEFGGDEARLKENADSNRVMEQNNPDAESEDWQFGLRC
jgi:hypothetical protein